jgi:hypothetical protein
MAKITKIEYIQSIVLNWRESLTKTRIQSDTPIRFGVWHWTLVFKYGNHDANIPIFGNLTRVKYNVK